MKSLRALGIFVAILLLVALGAVVALFLIENGRWIVLRFPAIGTDWSSPYTVREYESPLWMVMLVAFVLGALVVGTFIWLPSLLRRTWERGRERRAIEELTEELTDLRNLPVNEPAPLEDIEEEPREPTLQRAELEEDDAALLLASLDEERPQPKLPESRR